MTAEKQQNGWWVASDGNRYPPEQHPDFKPAPLSVPSLPQVETPRPVRIGTSATFKRLRYGGQCVTCGLEIPKGADGWHDALVSKVSCPGCPPRGVES